MKSMFEQLAAMTVAAVMLATPVLAQDDNAAPATAGNGPAVEESQHLPNGVHQDLRPHREHGPSIATEPTNEVRGSLFEAAASTPVPVNAEGEPIGSAPVSFTAVSAPHAKKFRKNDLVTIIVQEDSNYSSNAQTQSQKQQDFDLAFQNWMQLHTTQNGVPTGSAVGNLRGRCRSRSSSTTTTGRTRRRTIGRIACRCGSRRSWWT